VITWEGDLAAGVPLSITFQAVPVAFCSTSFTNTALLTGGFPGELSFSASSLISGTLPLVNFLPSNFTPEVGEVVTFTNLTTGDEPLSYLWSFGDGFTSTEISPSHVFTSVGAYQITLTATNACGFTEHTELLNVTCDSPQPYFNWVNDELVINFTNLTTGTLPIDYLWEFGDGLTSTQVAPTHSYAIPAEYTVTLNATNTCGTESYTAVVNAACTAPQTGFTWSSDDLSFLFTNTSTGRFPLDFLWTFGDSFSSTLESPPHTYTLPGQYTVTLNTTDLCGTGIYSEQVSASCPDPTAAFIWSVNGLSVNFTNLSTGTLPLDFLWDFGDGITSTEISPIHIYDTIGTYTVKLTAKEACGSSIFTAQIIIVGYPVYVPVIFNR
jgi:PKD repeat protein